MELNSFLASQKWLPHNLRDFHDQKDVFKTLHDWMASRASKDSSYKMPNWVEGQIYVIDQFLYFMACHGFILQKSRSNVEFCSLDESIKKLREKESEQLKSFLAEKPNANNSSGSPT